MTSWPYIDTTRRYGPRPSERTSQPPGAGACEINRDHADRCPPCGSPCFARCSGTAPAGVRMCCGSWAAGSGRS